jgi:DUF4097 and DUF4098 domain-containing protein YvlB
MLLSTMALLAAIQSQGFQTDTTFSVPQGTRLHVETQGGDITVRAWDRNQVRVQAAHSRRTHIDIQVTGAVVRLEAEADRGPANMVDYTITVPAWMSLGLEGMYSAIDVTGVRGAITAETLEGDITIKGPAESVKLESIQGRIVVQGIRGSTTINTVSESIDASDMQGDILAESVSGNIVLRRIDSKVVEAETVSGEILLDGRIVDGGRYSLLTHSGELMVTVPEGANATIATATGSGDVRASFPLPQSERPSRRRQTFRLGSGSATVELESFSGSIRLLRPAEMESRLERMMLGREERGKEKQKRPEYDRDTFDQDRS